MSCVYRVFVLIFLMLLTACATCAILFPIYRKTSVTVGDVTKKDAYYYWYWEASDVSSTSTNTVRIYTRDYDCDFQKNYFLASAALAVAGAGLGGLACMFMACWVNARHRAALGVVSLLLTFFAFACCATVASLTAYLYVTAQCDTNSRSFKQHNYMLVEGFILMAIAAGGFLIMLIVQIIGLSCEFCCGNNDYDDVSRDFSRYSSKSNADSSDSYSPRASRGGSYRR